MFGAWADQPHILTQTETRAFLVGMLKKDDLLEKQMMMSPHRLAFPPTTVKLKMDFNFKPVLWQSEQGRVSDLNFFPSLQCGGKSALAPRHAVRERWTCAQERGLEDLEVILAASEAQFLHLECRANKPLFPGFLWELSVVTHGKCLHTGNT